MLSPCFRWAFDVHSNASQRCCGDLSDINRAIVVNLHIGFALPSLYRRGSFTLLTHWPMGDLNEILDN